MEPGNGVSLSGIRGTLGWAAMIQVAVVALLVISGDSTRRSLWGILFMVLGTSQFALPALPYAIAGAVATSLLVKLRSGGGETRRVIAVQAGALVIGQWVVTWAGLAVTFVLMVLTGRASIH